MRGQIKSCALAGTAGGYMAAVCVFVLGKSNTHIAHVQGDSMNMPHVKEVLYKVYDFLMEEALICIISIYF